MAIIRNNDFSVGRTERINTNILDSEGLRLSIFYRNLNAEQTPYDGKAKSMTLKEAAKNNNGTPTNLPANFNDLIQTFEYAPPTDNLWNVEIQLSDVAGTVGASTTYNDKRNLLQLYKNIESVTNTWLKTKSDLWKVDLGNAKIKINDYISRFCNNEMGMFLANQVNFTPISLNVDDNPFGELQQTGSFYKNAKVVKSIKSDDNLKINFLVSNYDITDILIEPWIAAIAQHGLIETGNICLKAKIILREYSGGYPKEASEKKYEGFMKARKEYIFENCFPIQRDEVKKEYTPNEAGTYKNQIVTFKYDSYKIKYLF